MRESWTSLFLRFRASLQLQCFNTVSLWSSTPDFTSTVISRWTVPLRSSRPPVIPWELCESLLMLWNSEAAITTRLSVQVSVFHKISIIQGQLWHGVRGRGCYKRVKSTRWVRGPTITSPWFVSFAQMFSWCSRAHPGLRFLLKASTSTSHWPLNSCQQLVANTVIHQTQSLSGVTPNRKLYIGNLSWPIHLHSCEGNQSEVKWPDGSESRRSIRAISQLIAREKRSLGSNLHFSRMNPSIRVHWSSQINTFWLIVLVFNCRNMKHLWPHAARCLFSGSGCDFPPSAAVSLTKWLID